jgi:hypothetical protein
VADTRASHWPTQLWPFSKVEAQNKTDKGRRIAGNFNRFSSNQYDFMQFTTRRSISARSAVNMADGSLSGFKSEAKVKKQALRAGDHHFRGFNHGESRVAGFQS